MQLPTIFWLFRILVGIVTFLFANLAFDIAQVLGFIVVLLCHPSDIDLSDEATSLTLFSIAFFFFRDLGLGLKLTCISKSRIVAGLSLVSILMPSIDFQLVFFSWFVAI